MRRSPMFAPLGSSVVRRQRSSPDRRAHSHGEARTTRPWQLNVRVTRSSSRDAHTVPCTRIATQPRRQAVRTCDDSASKLSQRALCMRHP
eukprot:2731436-Prymnesium_polylepis.2